jgi:hypothetical protein
LIARISEERELELMSFAARESQDAGGTSTSKPISGQKKTPVA